MMACPNCNIENEDGSKFCKECGTKFAEIVCDIEGGAMSDSVNTNDKKKKFDLHKVEDIVKNSLVRLKAVYYFAQRRIF